VSRPVAYGLDNAMICSAVIPANLVAGLFARRTGPAGLALRNWLHRVGRDTHEIAAHSISLLSDRLGQPFVVENRPGLSGNIGTEAVVGAPPTAPHPGVVHGPSEEKIRCISTQR
jgi:hypothetical protein